jgi:hypothetical protein
VQRARPSASGHGSPATADAASAVEGGDDAVGVVVDVRRRADPPRHALLALRAAPVRPHLVGGHGEQPRAGGDGVEDDLAATAPGREEGRREHVLRGAVRGRQPAGVVPHGVGVAVVERGGGVAVAVLRGPPEGRVGTRRGRCGGLRSGHAR